MGCVEDIGFEVVACVGCAEGVACVQVVEVVEIVETVKVVEVVACVEVDVVEGVVTLIESNVKLDVLRVLMAMDVLESNMVLLLLLLY